MNGDLHGRGCIEQASDKAHVGMLSADDFTLFGSVADEAHFETTVTWPIWSKGLGDAKGLTQDIGQVFGDHFASRRELRELKLGRLQFGWKIMCSLLLFITSHLLLQVVSAGQDVGGGLDEPRMSQRWETFCT